MMELTERLARTLCELDGFDWHNLRVEGLNQQYLADAEKLVHVIKDHLEKGGSW